MKTKLNIGKNSILTKCDLHQLFCCGYDVFGNVASTLRISKIVFIYFSGIL